MSSEAEEDCGSDGHGRGGEEAGGRVVHAEHVAPHFGSVVDHAFAAMNVFGVEIVARISVVKLALEHRLCVAIVSIAVGEAKVSGESALEGGQLLVAD